MSRRSQGPEDERRDRGVATVWAASAVAVLLSVMVFGISFGLAVVGRHRAEAAADLAALAAAAHAVDGEQVACAYGDRVVAAMGGTLRSCRLEGWRVSVEVEVRAAVPLLPTGTAYGRARAGPYEG